MTLQRLDRFDVTAKIFPEFSADETGLLGKPVSWELIVVNIIQV
jgi:hypothetical protein